jgi:HPt (histidine-containing phosphotransfer) domain-containing protein
MSPGPVVPASAAVALDRYRDGLSGNVLDHQVLEQQIGGDRQLLEELTELFCKDYPALMEQLKSGASKLDYAQAAFASHSLKSMVGNFGAQNAWALAQEIELAAKAQDESIVSMTRELETELSRVAQALLETCKGVRQ